MPSPPIISGEAAKGLFEGLCCLCQVAACQVGQSVSRKPCVFFLFPSTILRVRRLLHMPQILAQPVLDDWSLKRAPYLQVIAQYSLHPKPGDGFDRTPSSLSRIMRHPEKASQKDERPQPTWEISSYSGDCISVATLYKTSLCKVSD